MKRRTQGTIVLIVVAVLAVSMCCLMVFCGGVTAVTSYIFDVLDLNNPFPAEDLYGTEGESDELWEQGAAIETEPPAPTQTSEPVIIEEPVEEPAPTQAPSAEEPTMNDALADAYETVKLLEDAMVPMADPEDLAYRLQGIDNIPEVVSETPETYQIGDVESFWLTNMDTTETFLQETRLAYITEHAYFWVDTSVSYNTDALARLAETFEEDIYPTNRAFFGSEWTPGIDGDEHLYIVYARGLGFSIAGYFSSVDSVHPLAAANSNAHETFMLNADAVTFNESFTYGVLAHEFQHMIHWYQDVNESTWLNEGFSELAALLNGYYDSGFDRLYLSNTDLQLNDWPNDGNTTPHYGAAFLFVTYFLDRFGDEATQALVADERNGMVSVDEVLAEFNATDGQTGAQITADEFFRDWAITNYLDDPTVEDGRYAYQSLERFSKTTAKEYVSVCGSEGFAETVTQYGVDYYELACSGTVNVNFAGDPFVELIAEGAHSGQFAFWTNKGDHSDMTLTRKFDLTEVDAGESAVLRYHVWYDIETDYDYVYVLTSEDGDQWEFIQTASGTDSDPVGSNYGWGYSGVSNGWVEESINLSKFAGEEVWVRFEYVTDAAVNGEGLLLDDVSLEAIGYSTSFEEDDAGWDAQGFVRTRNMLPQTFVVSVILFDNSDQITVEKLELSMENEGSLTIDFTDIDHAIVVVSGTTRHTRTNARYRLSFE